MFRLYTFSILVIPPTCPIAYKKLVVLWALMSEILRCFQDVQVLYFRLRKFLIFWGVHLFLKIFKEWNIKYLKPQLLEEQLVLADPVPLFKLDLGFASEQGLWRHSCWAPTSPREYTQRNLWVCGGCSYKPSQTTWSWTAWRSSSCQWQLSLCRVSGQCWPPEHGCRGSQRCPHQHSLFFAMTTLHTQ